MKVSKDTVISVECTVSEAATAMACIMTCKYGNLANGDDALADMDSLNEKLMAALNAVTNQNISIATVHDKATQAMRDHW